MVRKPKEQVISVNRLTFVGWLSSYRIYGTGSNFIRKPHFNRSDLEITRRDPKLVLKIMSDPQFTGYLGFQFYNRKKVLFSDGEVLLGEMKDFSPKYFIGGESGNYYEEIFEKVFGKRESYGYSFDLTNSFNRYFVEQNSKRIFFKFRNIYVPLEDDDIVF